MRQMLKYVVKRDRYKNECWMNIKIQIEYQSIKEVCWGGLIIWRMNKDQIVKQIYEGKPNESRGKKPRKLEMKLIRFSKGYGDK